MHAKRLQKLEVQHTFGCGAHTLTEWGLARSGEVEKLECKTLSIV